MTDREHDFGDAFDYTAPNCRENASVGMQRSSETAPVGGMPNDRSVVAAQLVEAACRAHEGDHEAARAHIAHAVELLECTPSSGSTGSRVTTMGERQVIAECLLAAQARRLIAHIGATLASRNSGESAPSASCAHPLDQVRLRRVLAYISTNIDAEITLARLAGIAGYSPFHFARKFTLTMGISPLRYISHMRLERAMAELAAGELPLAEIAFNAQFSSQASFTRAFHRATGMTPKEYQCLGSNAGEP